MTTCIIHELTLVIRDEILPPRRRKLPSRYTTDNGEYSNEGGLHVSGRLRLRNLDSQEVARTLPDKTIEVEVLDEQTLDAQVHALTAPIDDVNATDPRTVSEAQRSQYWDHWLAAMY